MYGLTNRLPHTSHPIPQNIAPTSKPILDARVRKGPLKWNSATTGERIKPLNNYTLRDLAHEMDERSSKFTHGPDTVTMHGRGFEISPRCSTVEN
jgi:hypothetical protein